MYETKSLKRSLSLLFNLQHLIVYWKSSFPLEKSSEFYDLLKKFMNFLGHFMN